MGEDLSVVYPTTHNDLAASEVGPLSNQDRHSIDIQRVGGSQPTIFAVSGLRLYTACRDPPSGITARATRSARGLACHGRKESSPQPILPLA